MLRFNLTFSLDLNGENVVHSKLNQALNNRTVFISLVQNFHSWTQFGKWRILSRPLINPHLNTKPVLLVEVDYTYIYII